MAIIFSGQGITQLPVMNIAVVFLDNIFYILQFIY